MSYVFYSFRLLVDGLFCLVGKICIFSVILLVSTWLLVGMVLFGYCRES